MWIADVDIEDCSAAQAPSASASSALPEFEAAKALVGPGWKPRPDDLRPWIVIDSLEPRTFGGLIIDWLGDAPASGFRIRGSNSGHRWKTLHTAMRAGGKRTYVYLPGLKTRFLRLELDEPSAGAALRLQSFEFSRSIHAFWHNIADAEARGWHPRWLHREQSVWTPIGTSNGTHCALMNEDGMVEVDQGSFSIEPMLWIEERLFTWADVTSRQELLEDWMPVPSSIWETARVASAHTSRGDGERRSARALPIREPHRSSVVRSLVRLGAPVSGHPALAEFSQFGRRQPDPRLWRGATAAVRVNETTLIAPMT